MLNWAIKGPEINMFWSCQIFKHVANFHFYKKMCNVLEQPVILSKEHLFRKCFPSKQRQRVSGKNFKRRGENSYGLLVCNCISPNALCQAVPLVCTLLLFRKHIKMQHLSIWHCQLFFIISKKTQKHSFCEILNREPKGNLFPKSSQQNELGLELSYIVHLKY